MYGNACIINDSTAAVLTCARFPTNQPRLPVAEPIVLLVGVGSLAQAVQTWYRQVRRVLHLSLALIAHRCRSAHPLAKKWPQNETFHISLRIYVVVTDYNM